MTIRRAFRIDGITSSLFGLDLLLFAGPLADFTGFEATVLRIIGVVALLWGAELLWSASRPEVPRWMAWFAVEMNTLWVIASIGIIVVDAFSLTTEGKWLVLLQADLVAVFVGLQWLALRRERRAVQADAQPIGGSVRAEPA